MSEQRKSIMKQGPIAFLSLGVSLTLLPAGAWAAAGDVEFQSSPTASEESCIIEVVNGGTLAASTDYTVLSSKQVGGTPGAAIVTSRKRNIGSSPGPRFTLTFEAPTGFSTMPAGGNNNVNFETRFSGASIFNGRVFVERRGTNGVRLPRRGTTVTGITGHLIATRSASVFPAGNYTATTILRCE